MPPRGRVSLVRSRGLEPPRLAALTPRASASTNSATTAFSRPARLAKGAGGNKRAADPLAGALENRDGLHVGGEKELVDGRHATQAIAAVDEDPGIAREGRGIAGDGGHDRHLGSRELLGLG